MDKLSVFNNGVKYLLICVDVFSRFVRVQPMKSKNSTDAVAAFKKCSEKTTSNKKVWVDQGTEFDGEFRKFCIYRFRNIIYRFMEENGYKYLVKMSSFLNTMNSRVNRSTGKAPKEVKTKTSYQFFTKIRSVNTKNLGLKQGIK